MLHPLLQKMFKMAMLCTDTSRATLSQSIRQSLHQQLSAVRQTILHSDTATVFFFQKFKIVFKFFFFL